MRALPVLICGYTPLCAARGTIMWMMARASVQLGFLPRSGSRQSCRAS